MPIETHSQAVPDGQAIVISGFVNATFFVNHSLFGGYGQGQNASWADQVELRDDPLFSDGDIRSTRVRFDFTGSALLGTWRPGAAIEADFFGGEGEARRASLAGAVTSWAFYGMDDPDEERYRAETGTALPREKNRSVAGMVRYMVGRYALGVEYLGSTTTWSGTGRSRAHQMSLSALYRI